MRGWMLVAPLALVGACSSFNGSDDTTPDTGAPDGGSSDGPPPVTGVVGDFGVGVAAMPDAVPVFQGETTKLTIGVLRGAKQLGPIRVDLEGAPNGISAVEATTTTKMVDLEIAVPSGASQGTVSAMIVVTGKDDVGSAVTAMTPVNLLVRGRPGALDTTWGSTGDGFANGLFGADSVFVHDLAVADDDSVYVVAEDDTSGSQTTAVVHLDSSGKLDASYGNGGVAQLALPLPRRAGLQPDGSLLVVGGVSGQIGRLTKAGQPDASFGGGVVDLSNGALGGSVGEALDVGVRTADGAIFVAFANYVGGKPDNGVAALTSNGTVRTGFGSSGAGQTANAGGGSLVVVRNNPTSLSAGNVALVWNDSVNNQHGFFQVNGDTGIGDPRENGNKRLVTVTGPTASYAPWHVELADDSIIVPITNGAVRLYKHGPLGDAAPGFGTDGFTANLAAGNDFRGLATQADGSIVVGVASGLAAGINLVRVTPGGVIDSSFGDNGSVSIVVPDAASAFGVAIQKKTGRILAGLYAVGGKVGGVAAFWP